MKNNNSKLSFLTLAVFLLLLAGCAKDKLTTLTGDQVIAFTVNPGTIQADNYTYAAIKVTVDNTSVALQNDIVFSCTGGSFSNGTATYSTTLDLSGIATAYLKSNTAQDVTVTATIHSLYANQCIVHFTPAYPDKLSIDLPDSVKNQTGLKIPITSHLLKQTGSFIPGITVTYTALDAAGNPIGSFTNNRPSDANGLTTVDFYPGNPAYKGNIFIKGYFIDGQNNMIPANNQLRIY